MRASGILLPITSIPSKYGVGTFGKEAYTFVDMLKLSGQKYWQVLPLGATGYGDSPYQSFSTFAGNPYFIDIEMLIEEGLLNEAECDIMMHSEDASSVDYLKVYENRYKILKIAFERNQSFQTDEYKAFLDVNSDWIFNYALFMALKDHFGGVSFLKWDEDIKHRESSALEKYKKLFEKDIEFYCFIQFKFFKQWNNLKKYANNNGIKIIGDIPIYVALDSADTWSNPELFMFDNDLAPTEVAGCPPDDFSKTGQLWGNPIYRWEKHKQDNYAWWIKRISAASKMYDTVRIDHFRGFAEYYSIKAPEKTAENGVWIEGPGIELFNSIKEKLGDLDIIAEDLGFLTPSVKNLLLQSGFPGMKVLQFGLYENSDSCYLPYQFERNSVCYTGTHDNQTTTGWIKDLNDRDMQFICKYLAKKDCVTTYDIILMALSSVSDLAIIPMQDYLDLDDSARMNIPSTIGGNWKWRLVEGQFSHELARRINEITKIYGR